MGDWVLAIGSPFALDQTVTAGIISSTERNDLRINEYEAFLQTDAAINSGNSGGPLVDLSGKVIGINTAMLTETGGYQGIGLAIPSSMARRVVEGLIKEGRVVRGYLGVQTGPLTPALAEKLRTPETRGAVVLRVLPDSPAAKAGLRVGDVIAQVGGKAVTDPLTLRNRTFGLAVGMEAPVTFYREGALQTVKVTITERPEDLALHPLGFRLRELGPDEAGQPPGMLVIDQVVPGSPAFKAGLRPGIRVLAVGQTRVHTMAEFDKAAAPFEGKGGLPLRILVGKDQVADVVLGDAP